MRLMISCFVSCVKVKDYFVVIVVVVLISPLSDGDATVPDIR